MAYGIKQPTILGKIQIKLNSHYDYHQLDELISPFVIKFLSKEIKNDNSTDSLVMRLLHWHIAFQRQNRIPVFDTCTFIREKGNLEKGYASYLVVAPYSIPKASVEVLMLLAELVNETCESSTFALSKSKEKLQKLSTKFLQKYAIKGANTLYLLRAAFDMSIPYQKIMTNMYCFGLGENTRWLDSTISDKTSSMGVSIAHNKIITANILRRSGFPVAQQRQIKNEEQALSAANSVGYPVVIKPIDQEQGLGVATDLRDDASVKEALKDTYKYSSNIMVEKHIGGEDYRITVILGKVLSVFKRRAGGIIGDGIHTIAELITIEQKKPKLQRTFIRKGIMLLELDNEARRLLSEANLTTRNIPSIGKYIALRKKKNISSGGSFKVVPLSNVHPDNMLLATRLSKILHLDMVGIDFISPDISLSWLETETTICEANAQPQIGNTISIEDYKAIFTSLMDGKYRIPISLVICISEEAYPQIKELDQISSNLSQNGLSTKEGIWLDGHRITKKFDDGFLAAQALLLNASMKSALILMTMPEVMKYGLPIDQFDSIKFLMKEPDKDSKSPKFAEMLAMLKAYNHEFIVINHL